MSEPIDVVERLDKAWNARAVDEFNLSPDARFEAPGGEVLHGPKEYAEWLAGFWAAFPDARLDATRRWASGSTVFTEGTFTGTHLGAFVTPAGEVAPTGASVQLRWCAVNEVRGDEVIAENLYFDRLDLLDRLGIAPAGPH